MAESEIAALMAEMAKRSKADFDALSESEKDARVEKNSHDMAVYRRVQWAPTDDK
jgi:hypothetical protein